MRNHHPADNFSLIRGQSFAAPKHEIFMVSLCVGDKDLSCVRRYIHKISQVLMPFFRRRIVHVFADVSDNQPALVVVNGEMDAGCSKTLSPFFPR